MLGGFGEIFRAGIREAEATVASTARAEMSRSIVSSGGLYTTNKLFKLFIMDNEKEERKKRRRRGCW
jgi:hypothetical protein